MPAQRKKRQGVTIDTEVYRSRVVQIQKYLADREVDGILLLDSATVIWASGFYHIPNERPLGLYIGTDQPPALFVPFLEKENAGDNWIEDVRWYWEFPGETPPEVWMLGQTDAGRVAVDGASHSTFEQLQTAKPGLRIEGGVAKMRYLKHDVELELTALAAEYADFGLAVARETVVDGLRHGVTELDVVQAVQSQTTAKMRSELAELINFYRGAVALTAHTGARAALPHGQPGPVSISRGDTLIVGIGVKVGGYHAESGCTFIIGEPTADQRRCLEATWACDEAALAALRPGTTCARVDEIALNVLREAGYGDHIRHRIGHGMGIDGHEAPWLSEGDHTVLQPSMVFSNEPGIYRPGIDGYRIIDSMVVTAAGGERLSHYLAAHGPDDRVIAA